MRTDYFDIIENSREFIATRYATTLEEAWEKTFEKWGLISMGYKPINGLSTCGLCNIFYAERYAYHCTNCPIKITTGKSFCSKTPIDGFFKGIGDVCSEKALDVIKFLYDTKNRTSCKNNNCGCDRTIKHICNCK